LLFYPESNIAIEKRHPSRPQTLFKSSVNQTEMMLGPFSTK
jgi:hypothetical protein